jgi:hypothetical protein
LLETVPVSAFSRQPLDLAIIFLCFGIFAMTFQTSNPVSDSFDSGAYDLPEILSDSLKEIRHSEDTTAFSNTRRTPSRHGVSLLGAVSIRNNDCDFLYIS